MCSCMRRACVCACVHICVFVYVSVDTRLPMQRSENNLSTLRETVPMIAHCCRWQARRPVNSLDAFVPASHLSVGVQGLQMHASTSGFTWLLGIWAPVLRLVPANTLPSEPSFLAFFYIPDTILMALKDVFRECGAGLCAFGSSWTAFNTVLYFHLLLLVSVWRCKCVCGGCQQKPKRVQEPLQLKEQVILSTWHSCQVLNSGHLEEQQVPFSFRCNFKWDCFILILNYLLPVYRNIINFWIMVMYFVTLLNLFIVGICSGFLRTF